MVCSKQSQPQTDLSFQYDGCLHCMTVFCVVYINVHIRRNRLLSLGCCENSANKAGAWDKVFGVCTLNMRVNAVCREC
eukprot:m.308501 g.308501  ORF g.308501 m.308501 type:complete len:78 (-) comp15940_c0_seq1:288-521(-)